MNMKEHIGRFEISIPNKTTLETARKTDAGVELNEYADLDEFEKKLVTIE